MTPQQPRHPRGLALFLLPLLPAALLCPFAHAHALDPQQQPQEQQPTGFVTAYLEEARGKLAEGDTAAARGLAERALERDQNSLETLQLLAEIAAHQQDLDTAVHSLHRWLDVHDARTKRRSKCSRSSTRPRCTCCRAVATL